MSRRSIVRSSVSLCFHADYLSVNMSIIFWQLVEIIAGEMKGKKRNTVAADIALVAISLRLFNISPSVLSNPSDSICPKN